MKADKLLDKLFKGKMVSETRQNVLFGPDTETYSWDAKKQYEQDLKTYAKEIEEGEQAYNDFLAHLLDVQDPYYFTMVLGVSNERAKQLAIQTWGDYNTKTYAKLGKPLFTPARAAIYFGSDFIDSGFNDLAQLQGESNEEYLDRFYDANRAKIDGAIDDLIEDVSQGGKVTVDTQGLSKRELFKNSVKNRMQGKKITNVEQGVTSTINSEVFTSADYRGRHNIMVAIQNDAKAMKKVQKLLDELHKPFEISKLRYDKDSGTYNYDNIFTIDTSDSPKEGADERIKITRLK